MKISLIQKKSVQADKKEIDKKTIELKNLTEQHKNVIKDIESSKKNLKKENEDLILMYNDISMKERIVDQDRIEKGKLLEAIKLKNMSTDQTAGEKIKDMEKELQEKISEIDKHKFNITVFENQFREKVSDYHVLSKTFAELDRKNDSDGQLLKVLENMNKKYCTKIKSFKKEIERLGGNVDVNEEKCDIDHKFQDKSHATPKETNLVEDLKDEGHGKVEKADNGKFNAADRHMNKAESLEANDK